MIFRVIFVGNVSHVSSSNLLSMLLICISRTSSIMAEKNCYWLIYCDFSHVTSIIRHCERDNLKSFTCILFKFVKHVTNKQFSDKFNNGWKSSKWPIYCDFSQFMSINWHCGQSFSCILFKFVMHVTNKHFSDKILIIAEKNSKWPIYCDFRILRQ